METFAWAESPGTSVDEEPRVNSVAFGDGYSQRGQDGLNPIAQRWSLAFTDVARTGGDEIIAFFRRHGGWQHFEWWPLWATEPIHVICPTWRRVQGSEPDTSTITATFQQVFEP